MIRTLIIDDEPLALQQLAVYASKIPFIEIAGQCQSAIEARAIIERERIDAIFIDINMPDLNGMDFVRSLQAPPLTVFTTAYSEYAVDGYKVDAVDYLLKPFSLDDFRRAASRVRRRYEMENAAHAATADTQPEPIQMAAAQPAQADRKAADSESLFLKTEHRVVRASIADIRYVESMSEYLKIYIEGQRPIVMLLSMKKMEERLPAYFMRIHRSYIVNMRKVMEVSKSRVMMDADTYLPVGDIYKDALMKYLSGRFLGR